MAIGIDACKAVCKKSTRHVRPRLTRSVSRVSQPVSIKSLGTNPYVAVSTRTSCTDVSRNTEPAAMAPSDEAPKNHWKIVFQKAWNVIKVDVDRGGEEIASDETGNDESGKEAVCCIPLMLSVGG